MSHTFLFKIRSACSECGEPLMVDGPLRTVRCVACQSLVEVEAQYWKKMMGFRTDEHARKRVTSTVFGLVGALSFHVRMGRAAPTCSACDHPLDLASLQPGMDGEVRCACGHATPTFPPPEWLRELDPTVVQILNAEREGAALKSPVSAQADRPVSFGCPDCGANLKITMESPRILACQYCKADLYLPDPLWRALHPVKKRSAWYMAFKG